MMLRNSNIQYPISNLQLGQTLIETMVAIFILVMGVTAAVGLAIYAFNSSTSITKQIIATGLAREGLEAVTNMRNTNWLKDTLSTTCYDYANPGLSDGNCYPDWLGDKNLSITPYCINPTHNNVNCKGDDTTDSYYLGYNYSAANPWVLTKDSSNFGLNFNPASFNNGFYSPSGSTVGNSGYYREIILNKNSSAPFNQNVGPELQVSVRVWWTDKNCPTQAVWPGLGKCSVELDTNLTNWKDY